MGTWKAETITAIELNEKIEKNSIKVPDYQRGIVWRENQKEKLIDSIKNGYPFGSLLIYRDDKKDLLIDGLQRTNTISQFINDPAYFFNENDIDDMSIETIYSILEVNGNKNEIKEKIVNILLEWVKTHKNLQDVERMQYINLVYSLIAEFPTAKGKEKLICEIISPMFESYINICKKIINTPIPILVFEGDEEILPEIFERINSQGTKLTKYQIYAATWNRDAVKIKNEELNEIIRYVIEMYEDRNSSGIQTDDYDSGSLRKEKEVNFYELIFGFGKLISFKYPHLFECNDNFSDVPTIGFNLINACLTMKNQDVKKLNLKIREIFTTDEKINQFLIEIMSCIDKVDKMLSKTIKFKGNSRIGSKIRPLHTEMQIVSIIASYFIMKNVELINEEEQIKIKLIENNANWKDFLERFKENMLKIYIMDIIHEKWKGSGDKKLNNIVENPDFYGRSISEEEFRNSINLWYDTIKQERKEYRKIFNVKEPEKIILNLVYSEIFSAADQIDDSKYDIEHLMPKALLRKRLEKFNDNTNEKLKLPISSIGNLCFLPEYENRVKKEKTIYHDFSYKDGLKISMKELEEKYTFTSETDMNWVDIEDINSRDFEEKYFKFIDNRFKKILDKLIYVLFEKQSLYQRDKKDQLSKNY